MLAWAPLSKPAALAGDERHEESGIARWHDGMPSLGPAVACIGVFDGVHLGHRALVGEVARLAVRVGLRSVVVTFDRDPDSIIRPHRAAPLLMEDAERIRELSRLGCSNVLVVPFEPEIAALGPEAFVDRVIAQAFVPAQIRVGVDFRFGARGAGSVATLQQIGERRGFDAVGEPLRQRDGVISSTRIRALVARGAVDEAASLLGRPLRLVARAVPDLGRGHICVLEVSHRIALPPSGFYAARVHVMEGRSAILTRLHVNADAGRVSLRKDALPSLAVCPGHRIEVEVLVRTPLDLRILKEPGCGAVPVA